MATQRRVGGQRNDGYVTGGVSRQEFEQAGLVTLSLAGVLNADYIVAAGQHVDEPNQHACGIGAGRRVHFLSVLAHHPGLKGVGTTDEDAANRSVLSLAEGPVLSVAEGPFQYLDLELAKAGGLVGGDTIAQRLGGRVWRHIGGEGAGKGSATIGPGLLQHGVSQPPADQRFHLTAQSPEAGLDIQEGHARPAKVEHAGVVFVLGEKITIGKSHRQTTSHLNLLLTCARPQQPAYRALFPVSGAGVTKLPLGVEAHQL